MTDVSVTLNRVAPIGGADNDGVKLGFVDSAAKAAQNDGWVVGEASEVLFALATTDADGAADPVTISGNVITLTSAATGASSGLVVYK